ELRRYHLSWPGGTQGDHPQLPAGTNVIEGGLLVGVQIPHSCYHPRLSRVRALGLLLQALGGLLALPLRGQADLPRARAHPPGGERRLEHEPLHPVPLPPSPFPLPGAAVLRRGCVVANQESVRPAGFNSRARPTLASSAARKLSSSARKAL